MLPNMTSGKSPQVLLKKQPPPPRLRKSLSMPFPQSHSAPSVVQIHLESAFDSASSPSSSPSPPSSPLGLRDGDGREPALARPTDPKSLNRRRRLLSLVPRLISSAIGSQRRSIQRKPVPSPVTSASQPDSVPPPPYRLHDLVDPSASTKDTSSNAPTGPLALSPPVDPISPLDDTFESPFPRRENTLSGPSQSHPQIMAPTPPSPESKRGLLTKNAPAPRPVLPNRNQNLEAVRVPLERPKSGKLQKENHSASYRETMEAPHPHTGNLPEGVLMPRQTIAAPEARGRSVSAQVPPPASNNPGGSRIASMPVNTQAPAPKDESHSPSRGRLRRSWLPSSRSRSNSTDVAKKGSSSYAWIMSEGATAEYSPSFLQNGEKVPELWNESGTVYVYLFHKASRCGPSFKVSDFTIRSSTVFCELVQTELSSPNNTRNRARSFGGRDSLDASDASRVRSPPNSPPMGGSPGDMRLYLPSSPPSAAGQLSGPAQGSHAELDRLIAIRNLFAFLTGQPLVGTKTRPTIFSALLQVAALLHEFGFSSADGITFGEAVDLSFEFYVDQLGLADCRSSREKTIEALILGERMRSMSLYNEAFAHAAGKYSAIMDLQLPLFEQVTRHTRQRLERAHLDLVNRQHNVNDHLESFEFPSLFAGIANSTSISELKQVRFKTWRSSFSKMRSFVLGHYKSSFGNWPPKASSKKNPFAESGLNRLVLKALYSDMCALYDLLVDRQNLTSRVIDEVPEISRAPDKMATSALRCLMSEYDRSKPPVLPPIPFDLPQMPSMAAVQPNYATLSSRDQAKFDKRIKENELALVLNKAYNADTNRVKLPFLDQFKEFELKEAKGRMCAELFDQRIGYWLFMYVVIQSLPMLVVDAPGLKFTDGTEYFLCQPPMGNPPWIEDRQVRKMWYEVAGGGRLVELSADAVMFSVEAIYNRSHCWLAAKHWDGANGPEPAPPAEPVMSPLQPPPILQGEDGGVLANPAIVPSGGSPPLHPGSPQMAIRSRNLSPGHRNSSRSSIAMGLEPINMPPADPSVRRSSLGPSLSQPSQGNLSHRSSSATNLAAMDTQDARSKPAAQHGLTSSTTFDDILGGTGTKPENKKKSKFF